MEIELLQIQCYQKADDLVCFMEGEQIKVNCKCALRLLASEQGDGYMKLQKQVKESRNQGSADSTRSVSSLQQLTCLSGPKAHIDLAASTSHW